MLELLGPWVAVQQIPTMHIPGSGLLRPWAAKAPECFVALVLALGTEIADAQFEVGDYILVERQSGHPHMAQQAPVRVDQQGIQRAGRIAPVIWDAAEWGGDKGSSVGFVRSGAAALKAPAQDEECRRRLERMEELKRGEYGRQTSLTPQYHRGRVRELQAHAEWCKRYDEGRADGRRSRLQTASVDNGKGEGIVAVIRSADDLLALGVDPLWLANKLGIKGDPEE